METKLSDLLFVFDDALDKSVCENLIKIFDDNEGSQQLIKEDGIKFNQLVLNDITGISSDFYKVINSLSKFSDLYLNKVGKSYFPQSYLYEKIRIKKYENNGEDFFDTHVDVIDKETSKRFVSFLFYLNDVEEGGETVFDFGHVVPKCGRLIMFPPLWMYPHKGNIPISNSKYIMSSYLHYR